MCVCASVHQRAIAVLRAGRAVKEPPLVRALIGKGEVLRLRVAAALAEGGAPRVEDKRGIAKNHGDKI